MRRPAALLALLLAAHPAAACTFCGGGLLTRPTLREHYRQAKFVARGTFQNPKFDPAGTGAGSTEFHVSGTLKADPAVGKAFVYPKYFPVVGTPVEYLLFGTVTDGKPDPLHAAPATAALAEYVAGLAKLDDADVPARLRYCFAHLDSADAAVAADAFHEFAKAPDAEIVRAKGVLDAGKLKKFLADPGTPADRLGVFAVMLGLCGTKADAGVLADLLAADPVPERVRENLGGLLAGLALLDPDAGWDKTGGILLDPKRPFDQRLTAVGTVRFFQGTRPDAKPRVLACYKRVVAQGDLADVAIDDLRRWGWWDLSADVFAAYAAQPRASKLFRRGVVRYALSCPGDDARRFVDGVRAADPELVRVVEDSLKLYAPVKP